MNRPMNRLQYATSPYLRQHADNPVDWYEWGDEALTSAREQDKPIMLSIGYSACHWCHVMAHESFEDPATAAIMNRDFINIKVDREERPDLDQIYMQATLAINQGNGGWPMTVFLLPDGRPFHAGTYFPAEDRYGMPSFRRVLAAVNDAFTNRRAQIDQGAAEITDHLRRLDLGGLPASADPLNPELLTTAFQEMVRGADMDRGGLSPRAPKFPAPMNYEYLLRTYVHTGDQRALDVVNVTLDRMARGGIYDQLAGGFARYSVDAEWLVPHFEKMLYDNAGLSRLYLHAWQVTGNPFFKRIAEETYDYILREMTSGESGFYSATDADSEGEEGKFFVWTIPEVRDLLPPEQADAVIAYYGMTEKGNFEGANILYRPVPAEQVASKLGISETELQSQIDSARHTLYAARTQRIPPGLDDKILTSWNGLMLSSLAEAARILKRDDYFQAAVRNADFLLDKMVTHDAQQDVRLLHTYKDGQAKLNGYLEDYAFLIDALIQVYQLTFESRYLQTAIELVDSVLEHFRASDGGFYDVSDDHETLITRPRNVQDNATPAASNSMAKVLALLFAYTGEPRYDSAARATLGSLPGAMTQYPSAFGEALNAADLLIRGVQEVAIIGDPTQPDTAALLDVYHSRYRPNAILAIGPGTEEGDLVPALLTAKTKIDGKAAAYVCRGFVCERPVIDPAALTTQLESRS